MRLLLPLCVAATCLIALLYTEAARADCVVVEPVDGLPMLEVEGACPLPDRPAVPFWKRCVSGLACAKAVLPHYFRNWRYALGVVRCETGGTFSNRARGSAGERGWLQIHPWWWHDYRWIREGRLWDVRYNAAVARWIVNRKGGWSHWTCA
jgi:hypothetical protein